MQHRLLRLLQCSNQHTDVCLLARAACDALGRSSAEFRCSTIQHVRSTCSAAVQQLLVQQQQQEQQQKQRQLQQQLQQKLRLQIQEERWLPQPSAGLQQPYLATQQQQQQQQQQQEVQNTPSSSKETTSSSEGSSSEGTRSGEGSSKEGTSSDSSSSTSSTGSAAAGDSSSSGSSSGREPPDEALLAEWRSTSAQWYGSGLNYIVHGHLDMPSMSSWSYLYRQQPGGPLGLLSQLIWPKGASAMTRVLRWNFAKASTVAVPLLEEAHGDFEAEEFNQCASQAVCAVLELYAAADWAAIRPMVSSGLLQSMQEAHAEQEPASNVRIDVHQLEVVCVHSITQQQLAAIDEQRAGQQLTPAELEAAAGAESADGIGAAATAAAGQSYWDVCHVYVEATWRGDVKLDEEAAASEVQQPRSGHWVMCRGPVLLNKAIPAEADKPWFMLAWM